jgi:C-terminal processing protease CtpA/Prc
MENVKIIIESIKQGSIADELGLEPGDELLAINGEKIGRASCRERV